MSGENTAGDDSMDAIEKELQAIWANALRVKQIDVQEDFFQLGGDSLAAMLCISRMKSAFGVEFLIEDFFLGEATISKFAAIIHRAGCHS